MKSSISRYLSIIALVGMGLLIFKAWLGVKSPPPLAPSPPITIEKVLVCPCYTRLTYPSQEELMENVQRVVSITDTLIGAYKAARSNTLLLKFPHFKVVIFPELTEIVIAKGKLPFLKKGNLITVRGLIINHPRYGLEIVLKRPEDLVVGVTA